MHRLSFFAVAALASALSGCQGGERASPASPAPAAWGDRTVALTYRDGDPLIAYFTAGQGAGRVYVWDGGEPAIVRGDWRLDGARLCMSLSVLRRDSATRSPLRAPACVGADDPALAGRSYRGDVFSLKGLAEAPYILSQADNERLITVLHDAERMAR